MILLLGLVLGKYSFCAPCYWCVMSSWSNLGSLDFGPPLDWFVKLMMGNALINGRQSLCCQFRGRQYCYARILHGLWYSYMLLKTQTSVSLCLSLSMLICSACKIIQISVSIPYSIIQKASNALEVLTEVLDAVDTQHPEVWWWTMVLFLNLKAW